jgi:aryl-alcohol dehydrogenase-like predicted oxidoreductase
MIERQRLSNQIALGATGVKVNPIGIGTWQWGDRFIWGYGGGTYTDADLRAAFDVTLASGITFFDTAEVYGFGRSEQLLGKFIRASGQPVVVATKFAPLPWRILRSNLVGALRGSLRRLGLPHIDVYQVHWYSPPRAVETWAAALADAVEAGLTRAVGVSNFDVDQMRRAHDALARRGIPLASNQVEYSLLHRTPEQNGLLAACRDLNVTLIAYSPLGKGLLTGKYSPERLPPGARGRYWNKTRLESLDPLLHKLRSIAGRHGKTLSQVALNWSIAKGALPIPGVKNARQAADNIGAIGWSLTAEDVAALDQASAPDRNI